MVTTGARVAALQELFERLGYEPAGAIVAPRPSSLSADRRDEVLRLYRALGGTQPSPQLRPGAWDLVLTGGLFVELDEELHFNRYRRTTLEPAWTTDLPWRDDYLRHCNVHEPE